MSEKGSIVARVDIDISPDGISLRLFGVDTDLAQLIEGANMFEVLSVDPRNMGNADVHIRSVKALSFVDREQITPPVEGAQNQ